MHIIEPFEVLHLCIDTCIYGCMCAQMHAYAHVICIKLQSLKGYCQFTDWCYRSECGAQYVKKCMLHIRRYNITADGRIYKCIPRNNLLH